jgi:DNA repair protein RecN (Recombination protein N)
VEAEEGVLVLKREVAVEGRNRAWINGSPATASLLGEVGATLVSLHGQHEHQTLLRRDEQRAILDAYASNESLLECVRGAYHALRAIRREVEELDEKRREVAARADFLRFQVDEIEAAELRAGEEQALEDEQRRLSHSEELMALSTALAEALTDGDESLVTRLAGLRRGIDQLVRIDQAQQEVSELFDNAYYTLEELGNRMARYAESVEYDPARLEEIRGRQDLLYRLKAKYGPTLDDVIATGERARAELDLVDNAGWEAEALRKREAEARVELEGAASELTGRRTEAMRTLAEEVNAVLPELGMAGGRFEAVALPLAAPGAGGAEEVEFRITLNKGFDPKPLAQVASGGELSRVMLALKTILARLDAVPTVVFDEVDAGVGGRVALQLGDKLRQVAGSHQVFAITHLPQIASRAHHHLLVRKSERGGITATEVDLLEGEGRVREVARMLGGDPESEVSLRHARELLDRGALAV